MRAVHILQMILEKHPEPQGKQFLVSYDLMMELGNEPLIKFNEENEASYYGHGISTHYLLKPQTAMLLSERDFNATVEQLTKLMINNEQDQQSNS